MTALAALLIALCPAVFAATAEQLRESAETSFLDARANAAVMAQNARLDYPKLPLQTSRTEEEGTLQINVTRVDFGPDGGTFHLYLRAKPSARPKPMILVLPNTRDPGYLIARSFCRNFVVEKYRCAYLERPNAGRGGGRVEDIFDAPGLPPQSAIRARRVLDALEQLGYVRPGETVGVVGISMGAIDAALVAATDERVAAAALLLGGGDLPLILSRTQGAGVESWARLREAQMRAESLTLPEFKARLTEKTGGADPLTYFKDGSRLPAERFLMINVRGDTAIPNESSELLRRAISRGGAQPDYELVNLPLLPNRWKHVGALLDLGYFKMRVSGHFARFLTPAGAF